MIQIHRWRNRCGTTFYRWWTSSIENVFNGWIIVSWWTMIFTVQTIRCSWSFAFRCLFVSWRHNTRCWCWNECRLRDVRWKLLKKHLSGPIRIRRKKCWCWTRFIFNIWMSTREKINRWWRKNWFICCCCCCWFFIRYIRICRWCWCQWNARWETNRNKCWRCCWWNRCRFRTFFIIISIFFLSIPRWWISWTAQWRFSISGFRIRLVCRRRRRRYEWSSWRRIVENITGKINFLSG